MKGIPEKTPDVRADKVDPFTPRKLVNLDLLGHAAVRQHDHLEGRHLLWRNITRALEDLDGDIGVELGEPGRGDFGAGLADIGFAQEELCCQLTSPRPAWMLVTTTQRIG